MPATSLELDTLTCKLVNRCIKLSATVCEICNSETQQLFEVHGYWIRGCAKCGHRTAEIEILPDFVAKTFSDDYFFGGEAGYSNYFLEKDLLRARGRWYARKLARFITPGRVFDVGAAAGFILQGFTDCGWKGWGIEPNARLAAFARNDLHLCVEAGSFERFDSSQTFDLVSMIQVVAHFEDIRCAMQVSSQITHPGSHLLIETWNWRSLTARLFGQTWHEYSPPSVLRWFTPESLARLVCQFGFQKVAQGRPLKRILGSHAKSILEFKARDSRWMAGPVMAIARLLPDSLEIPYLAEDLFWMLFKKY